MKITVTGAGGFLGTHLCEELFAEGYDSVFKVRRKDFDLRQRYAVENLYKQAQPDILIHLAGTVGGIQANRENPGKFFYENMLMGMNLIEGARVYGKLTKFVQIGTVCFTDEALINSNNIYLSIKDGKIINNIVGLNQNNSIKSVFQRKYSGTLISIRPTCGEYLDSTPEHPYYVWRENKLDFIKAKDIIKTDYLVIKKVKYLNNNETIIKINNISNDYPISNLPNKSKNIPDKIIVDKDFAWFFGWFLAEGYTGNNSDITLYFGEEHDTIIKLQKIIKEKFNLDSNIKKCSNQKGYRLDFYSKAVSNFLKENFYIENSKYTAHFKKIPNFILNSSNDIIKEFLNGYLLGDGHIQYRQYKNSYAINAVMFTSSSKNLLYQLQNLLFSKNIIGRIIKRKACQSQINGRIINGKDNWILKFTGNECNKIVEFIIPEKKKNLIDKNNKHKYIINDEYIYVPIFEITSKEVDDIYVYNIETSDNTYCVNNFIVHNCSYPLNPPIPFSEIDLWNGYPEPTNAPYGIAKKALLVMLQAYKAQYGLNSIYLIPTNLYGPGDNFDLNDSHVIPALIRKIYTAKEKNEDFISVWGDGSASREFLYVKDAAKLIVRAMQVYEETKPLNLGVGEETRILALVDVLTYLIGYDGKIVWQSDRPNGQPRRCLSVKLMEEKLGVIPKTNLADGLKETIEWYKNNAARLNLL